MAILGPQCRRIIKHLNSNFSSSFYSYTWPKEKKMIWNMSRGVVPYGRTNKITQTLQKQAGYFFCSVTICELNMWEAPFKLIQTLCLLASSVFSWNKNQGTLERSYNEIPTGSKPNISKVVEGKNFWRRKMCNKKNLSTRNKPTVGIELFWELFRKNYRDIFLS